MKIHVEIAPPQYDEIRVEVFYSFGTISKWCPALGWNSLEEAKRACPSQKFRSVEPPIKIESYATRPVLLS